MRRLLIPTLLIPTLLSLAATACVDAPQQQARRQPLRQSTQALPANAEARQCLADLGARQAVFTPVRDENYGAGCGIRNSVQLASLRGDNATLGLANLGPVTCPLAQAFAGWARFGVDRAARQVLGSALVRVETMGSFSCRNVAGTSRRSAHATANAVDVSGFVLADGRRILVARDWEAGRPEVRQFLRLIHGSACKRFGTVLGPAYNAAHHDHLHVELSGGGFCR